MKTRINQISAAAFLSLAVGFVPLASAGTSHHDKQVRGLKAAQNHRGGVSAHDLIGQDVDSKDNQSLGEIQDLVVDTAANRVDYALISTGGVLGIGDTVRAVPFAAFRSGAVSDGALTLDVTKAKFEAAPKLEDKKVATLVSQRKNLNDYYGVKDSMMSKISNAMSDKSPNLQRASDILGENVVNSGQNVGDIEDVLVSFENCHATVLIDPNDDYTSTDKKFLIGFDRLNRSADGDSFTTNLTKDDFAQAAPADSNNNNWWENAVTTPLVWGGYDGISYAAASSNMAANGPATSSPTPVSQIDQALHSDSDLKGELSNVSLKTRGGDLMIQGTVRNEDVKDKIADKVEDAAKGWDIQNQLYVQND